MKKHKYFLTNLCALRLIYRILLSNTDKFSMLVFSAQKIVTLARYFFRIFLVLLQIHVSPRNSTNLNIFYKRENSRLHSKNLFFNQFFKIFLINFTE